MRKIIILFLCLFALLAAYSIYVRYTLVPESPFKKYQKDSPHTYRLGFTNLMQEVSVDSILVVGNIPEWLSGTLFRNGPAQFTTQTSWVSNWFDGLAMVHAFSFNNGVISYSNRFLKSDDYRYVQKTGKMDYEGFAQDPCKSIFRQLFSFFVPAQKERMPNANVNIACYTNRLVALTETPLPIEFDSATLETLGVMRYTDSHAQVDIHDTAHPQYDSVRQEHIGYFTQFGRHSTHNVFRIKDGSTRREIIASIPTDKPSYMHSFFITERYAILTLLPLVVNPLALLFKKQSFIKNFSWQPALGTRLAVVDRINNKLYGIYKTAPFFAFHTVNAFEQDNSIVMDIVMYPDPSVINDAQFVKALAPWPSKKIPVTILPVDASRFDAGQLIRMTLNLSTEEVEVKKLFDQFVELPRINYDHYSTKPYTYVYAYGKKHSPMYVADVLFKINVTDGIALEWHEPHCYPGEPVFVAAPRKKSEDDGVVLSVVLDVQKGTSFLLVLDALTFKERARAWVPHHIPFGIHGLFLAQRCLAKKIE